ncbi:KH domain-containing protein akap-1 isoform X2 [Aethina tumida]|uniref:KH domain-containing protein akap-1 isoform X2 n=1 Tax=Aethina tumida TaxID=116153 RepID=UPI0021478B14|nr:KH domain-containing protein akap-1 isoform X2 [Aethina tumida]
MAPSHSRQFLAWSLPTIAVILSYLWYKKKRIGAKSDPGELSAAEELKATENGDKEKQSQSQLEDQVDEALKTPQKLFNRSLSGVETSPIDIVVPKQLRSKSKSNPVIISDEDLDVEIEKVRSMKSNGNLSRQNSTPTKSGTPSPVQEKQPSPVIESFSPVKQSVVQSPIKIRSPAKEAPIVFQKVTHPQQLKQLQQQQQPTQTNKQRKSKKGKKQLKAAAAAAAMAQKDIAVVEEKLANMQIGNKENTAPPKNGTTTRQRTDSQRRSSERDSANHSPADVMLASPSLSSISDNHSEKSTDSGKGGSDPATPPPAHHGDLNAVSTVSNGGAAAVVASSQRTIYEFLIPQPLVGKLIGRNGFFVAQIREQTKAHIVARNHPSNRKVKLCTIEGTQDEIEKALKMVRDKFPLKRFPEMTLEQVNVIQQLPQQPLPLFPDHLYLKLIEGINNDTILSCMVAPDHLFLQQPMHPTFPNLNLLVSFMNQVYAEEGLPTLPNPIPLNTVCVAYSVNSWYRAVTLSTDEESQTTYVKFLDYGGYAYVENSNLRQIRGDFMLLPFQAAECLLANIKPAGGDQWSEGAYELVAEVTKGALIYTQIIDYAEEGLPLVFCYIVSRNQVIFLNQLLVDEGHAEWLSVPYGEVQADECTSTNLQPLEGAAGITA